LGGGGSCSASLGGFRPVVGATTARGRPVSQYIIRHTHMESSDSYKLLARESRKPPVCTGRRVGRVSMI
jgi:hypothetical protein